MENLMNKPIKPTRPNKPSQPDKNKKVNMHRIDAGHLFISSTNYYEDREIEELAPTLQQLIDLVPKSIDHKDISLRLDLYNDYDRGSSERYFKVFEGAFLEYTTPFDYEKALGQYHQDLEKFAKDTAQFNNDLKKYNQDMEEYKSYQAKIKLEKKKASLEAELKALEEEIK